MNLEKIKDNLKEISLARGAALFGVCRIDDLRRTFHPEIRETTGGLDRAISVGVPLLEAVMETICDRPNMLYRSHYLQVNNILNDIAFEISVLIEKEGRRALPLPASHIMDYEKLTAHLSHREIAFRAGLGWWGRNNLLVTRQFGSRIRLVTVLTDLDLPFDEPLDDNCGGCMECLYSCPAGAIYEDREMFDRAACFKKVSEFSRTANMGHLICGVCLKACPGQINRQG